MGSRSHFGVFVVSSALMLALTSTGCGKKDSGSSGERSPSPSDHSGNAVPRWSSKDEFNGLVAKDRGNLKVIGNTMFAYSESNGGHFPPAAICDANGKPLLSWRVAILPYADEGELYKQFKLDEPWDSAHNKTLIARMPPTYLLPGTRSEKEGLTHYRVFVAPSDAPGFHPIFAMPTGKSGKLQNRFRVPIIPDGSSNTILVVESAEPVIWTKPDELVYDDKKPVPKLGYFWNERGTVLMADTSTRSISPKLSEKTLRLAITADDGQPLPIEF